MGNIGSDDEHAQSRKARGTCEISEVTTNMRKHDVTSAVEIHMGNKISNRKYATNIENQNQSDEQKKSKSKTRSTDQHEKSQEKDRK